MNEDDKAADLRRDDGTDVIHDLANAPPAKSLDKVKAASDAVDAGGEQGRAVERQGRVKRRAHDLWKAAGETGSQDDFLGKAEADIAREG